MLTLEAHARQSNVHAIARAITRRVVGILGQIAKKEINITAAEFIIENDQMQITVFDDELDALGATAMIAIPKHALQLDRIYVYIFTDDNMQLYEQMDGLDECPDNLNAGTYGADKYNDGTYEWFVRAILILPEGIDSINLQDEYGRRSLEGIYAKLKSTLVHELTHAQQNVPVPADDQGQDALPEEAYMVEPDEIEAFTAQIKSNARRLVKLLKRDPDRYLRIVGRINNATIRKDASDVEALMQRPDRYTAIFRIALELFIADRGIDERKPGLATTLRDLFTKQFHSKYLGIHENFFCSVFTKLLENSYLK